MKNLLFTLTAVVFSLSVQAQESLLDDLLNVQPVEMKIEGSEELQAEYQKELDDSKAELDDDLGKLDEDYKKEVGSMIEDFNKVLEKTVEQEIKNTKRSMLTKLTTGSMELKKKKKDLVTQFKNGIVKTIRELPKGTEGKKSDELDDIVQEYMDNFETQYRANLNVIKTFEKTEHITKSAETASSGGE